MASFTFTVFFLILLSITISSRQIHARDSQFFSKVTAKPTETQTVLPDKAQEQQSLVDKQETEPMQQPEFVPQNESGYGLYGHETGLNPPESDAPATYTSEKYFNNDKGDDFRTEQFGNGNVGEAFYSKSNNAHKFDTSANTEKDDLLNFDDVFDTSKDRNGETFYSKSNNAHKFDASANTEKDDLLNFDDVFDTSKDRNVETFYSNNNKGVGTEHYTQKQNNFGGDTYYNTDRNDRFGSQLAYTEGKKETYYKDNRFDDSRFTDELNARYNAYRGETNAERKGMSDTRFLENGRYYYDLDKEQKQNTYSNRQYQSDSKYDHVSLYDNSGAGKYEFNTMDEYERSRLNNQYDP